MQDRGPVTLDELLARARSGLTRLSPAEAYAEQQAGALLVDTRTDSQRARDGAVPGALVIDRTVLEWRLAPSSRWRIPEATGPDVRVVLFCNEGYSSSLAAAGLQQLGLPRATDVTGGFQAWAAAGLPVLPPGPAGHWDRVHGGKPDTETSWYAGYPAQSLALLDALGAGPADSLVDVGGGTSRLVDVLVDRGHRDLTVLDVAATALAATRARLGERADAVVWLAADVTTWQPERTYDLWHDRAVFHFLTEAHERDRYRHALRSAVRPGGGVVVATFALDGPAQCSGLPVVRYDAAGLAAELGLVEVTSAREEHRTPWGAVQPFTWVAGRLAPRRDRRA